MADTVSSPSLSAHATSGPAAFLTSNPRALEIVDKLSLKHAVNESPVVDSAFGSTDGLISVGAGKPDQPNATEEAVRHIRATLRITATFDERRF